MEFTVDVMPEIEDRPWASHAACRDADPDVFFSERETEVANARRICSGCAVRDDCLDWALDMRIRYGVWGGATPRERRRMLRRSA